MNSQPPQSAAPDKTMYNQKGSACYYCIYGTDSQPDLDP